METELLQSNYSDNLQHLLTRLLLLLPPLLRHYFLERLAGRTWISQKPSFLFFIIFLNSLFATNWNSLSRAAPTNANQVRNLRRRFRFPINPTPCFLLTFSPEQVQFKSGWMSFRFLTHCWRWTLFFKNAYKSMRTQLCLTVTHLLWLSYQSEDLAIFALLSIYPSTPAHY